MAFIKAAYVADTDCTYRLGSVFFACSLSLTSFCTGSMPLFINASVNSSAISALLFIFALPGLVCSNFQLSKKGRALIQPAICSDIFGSAGEGQVKEKEITHEHIA